MVKAGKHTATRISSTAPTRDKQAMEASPTVSKCDLVALGSPPCEDLDAWKGPLTQSHQSHHSTCSLVVFLPTFWFRLAWVSMFSVQVAVAITILHYGYLFRYLSSEGMTFYCSMLGLMSPAALARVATYLLVLSAWHALMATRTIWASIQSRRIAFTYVEPHQNNNFISEKTAAVCGGRHFLRLYHWLWYEFLGRRGPFGVESPVFDVLFVLREIIEIGSQTYQTFRLTHLVASPWINNISTLLVICNCVSTPVVRYFCRERPAIERALCLTIDAVLDISSSLAIPLSIFWPYYQAFDPEILGFADDLMYDDVWPIRAMMENKQIYMTSELDCVSKMVPLISMVSSFNGIRKLLQEKRVTAIKPLSSGKHSSRRFSRSAVAAVAGSDSCRGDRFRSSLGSFWVDRVSSLSVQKAKRRINVFVHWLFLLWAILVSICHLIAMKTSYGTGAEFGCKLSTRPWFSKRFSCAVLEINCHRQRLLGADTELGRIMTNLEGGSLSSLIFSHCPELSVPPQVQQFPNLLSMEVYNSTIVDWPVHSAITQQKHPVIGLLYLIRCNMTALPDGVLFDHPRTLSDIAIVASNLTSLPADLHEKWPGVSSFLLEQGQFTEMPLAVGKMSSLIRLSLAGNSISLIPDDLFADTMQLFTLALSGSPFSTLPPSVGGVANFKTVYLDYTNVADLPLWILNEAFLEAVLWISMYSTPYCEPQKPKSRIFSSARAHAAAAASARIKLLLREKIRCTPEKNRVDGFFPLAQVTQKRVP